MNEIKTIVKAILEKESHGQLCPQTIKELKETANLTNCEVPGCLRLVDKEEIRQLDDLKACWSCYENAVKHGG